MNYLKNTSYIFIPFTFEKRNQFAAIDATLSNSQAWTPIQDEIMYMLKYVADKMDSEDREKCQCFHYDVKENVRKKMGLATSEEWYTTEQHIYKGGEEKFRFQILGVQLYSFSTTVCIMAFKIHFEKDDPMWISSAQYYLKKVSREKIRLENDTEDSFTFLDMSKRLVDECTSITKFDFFYYANPSTERSNMFTYLEVDQQDSYQKELFYLRNCYNEGFMYFEDDQLDKEELYIPSPDTMWGISSEAAICLVSPEKEREQFIQNIFYENFNAQYLFMYILLLHQKYALYMFLTKIGIGEYNNLEMLEKYRHQLYEFETDFVFSLVTEVPQYQNLYKRMMDAFSLKKMYENVHEPILALSEMRQSTLEVKQKKRDKNVNRALIALSLLTFFSALADSFAFVDSFCGLFLSDVGVKVVQVSLVVVIVTIMIGVIINLMISNKD